MLREFRVLMCAGVGALALMTGACNPDPGFSEHTPEYRSVDPDEASSGERGNVLITEINFAGSVRDDGTYDPDDVFIELQNKHPRPINFTGWHLILEGDYVRTLRIPKTRLVEPNEFFVIAAKDNGAFADSADLFMPEMRLGKQYVHIELRDADRRLIEGAGSEGHLVFAGGYDTVTVRSMERAQIIFGNQGGNQRNWHSYADVAPVAGTVADGWTQHTLVSPGFANSPDYSGSVAGGTFE